MKKLIATTILALAMITISNNMFAQSIDKDVIVIELTQTEGQFETHNLNLKPGKYQFRVVNKDVNKDVGFVIQKASDKDGDVMKTGIKESFSSALIKKGEAQYTGVVELGTGDYVYSCPLNPTPHYKITVK